MSRRMRSADLPRSIIELMSFMHSTNVRRRALPEMMVTGPRISDRTCRV